MRRKGFKEKVLALSQGTVSTVTDYLLFQIFFWASFSGKAKSMGNIFKAMDEAEALSSEVNFETMRNALRNLKRKGLIEAARGKILEPSITKMGLSRIKENIPKYRKERSWDGRIYLVTYDISEKKRRDRDTLRYFLQKTGAGMLQRSVWLTPYNPKGMLRQFIKENGLSGAIIISDIGKDGSVGEYSLSELLDRVYRLRALNCDYLDFLQRYAKARREEISKPGVAFDFWSILSRDPQIPFELLPSDWVGDRAYERFKELTNWDQIQPFWEEV